MTSESDEKNGIEQNIPVEATRKPRKCEYCEICDQEYDCLNDLLNHLNTSLHLENLRQKNQVPTEILVPKNPNANKGEEFKIILDPAKHQIEISRCQSEFLIHPGDEGIQEMCLSCYVEYTSLCQKNAHLNGQDHQKKYSLMQKLKTPNGLLPKFYCDICYVELNSSGQLEIHKNSPSHKENILKREKMQNSLKFKTNIKKSATISNILLSAGDQESIKSGNYLKPKFEIGMWLDKQHNRTVLNYIETNNNKFNYYSKIEEENHKFVKEVLLEINNF